MNLWTELQEELRQAYGRYTEAKRNVRLPSTLAMEMDGNTLLLGLNAKAVSDNMQTDAAAFEAWALVLRLWLGAERVPQIVLDWNLPPEPNSGHYQRFLYRVKQFRTLFPEWFDIADPKKLEVCRALTDPQPIADDAWSWSMWRGYLVGEDGQRVQAWFDGAGTMPCHIHTSGHSSEADLREFASAINPAILVPIHGVSWDENLADFPAVRRLADGEPMII